MRVGIVGGGLMGMALARKYASDGHEVTVVEYDGQVGGLATWSMYEDFSWDRFHHVILPSDQNLISLIKELEMEDELEWHRAYTGVYADEKLHPINNSVELLKFPQLSLFSKIRLGFTLLHASRIDNWQSLESITCEDWLRKNSGGKNFEKLWKPLLLARLGPGYKRVSAVFIWSYIKRMLSAREKMSSALSKDWHFGHVRGGYESIFRKLGGEIIASGGRVILKETVMRVSCNDSGVSVHTPQRKLTFDQVVCTCPTGVFESIVDDELLDVGLRDVDRSLESAEYLGIVCVVLVTKTPITKYFAVTTADEKIPFAGLVGMSNVVDVKNTHGYHLTYLPSYLLPTDPEFGEHDNYFREAFLDGVKRIFPDFPMQDIISTHVHRATNVQPLQVLNYSSMVPSVRTNDPRLHLLNTSQFVSSALNNNEVIGAVNRFYDDTYAADSL